MRNESVVLGSFDSVIFEFKKPRDAIGATLAHDVSVGATTFKEGIVLDESVVQALASVGVVEICAARLDPSDVSENAAAQQMVDALAFDGLVKSKVRSGRVNLHAAHQGTFILDEELIHTLNALDPGLSIATVSQFSQVGEGERVASIKVIPFGIRPHLLNSWIKIAKRGQKTLYVAPVKRLSFILIVTHDDRRGAASIRRLMEEAQHCVECFCGSIVHTDTCQHTVLGVQSMLSMALAKDGIDVVIVAGAKPTLDLDDIVGRAVFASGGHVRFLGLPIDPGNQTMCAEIAGVPILALGIRGGGLLVPALALLVARLAAGLPLSWDSVSRLGVGSLSYRTDLIAAWK